MIRIRVPVEVFQALLQRDWGTSPAEIEAPAAFNHRAAGPTGETGLSGESRRVE
jgi:hypothetical protein